MKLKCVAPLVGARIEIFAFCVSSLADFVAPLVGARIEINPQIVYYQLFLSLPSWERGLKLQAHKHRSLHL